MNEKMEGGIKEKNDEIKHVTKIFIENLCPTSNCLKN